VREALREIAAMGLIELRPNRGAVVMPFNPDSLRGIFHVRMALECEATRLAAGRIPIPDLDRFDKQFAELQAQTIRERAWSDQAIASDEAFHALIATWAGVARLAMELKRYSILVHEIRETLRYRTQDETFRQLAEILKALRAGDAEQAAEAMREHIIHASTSAVLTIFNETQR
jgi:DNA-binding GntR family transcriptional regulator